MTATDLQKLCLRYKEVMKRGVVIALALELGLTRWTIRTMLDGEDAVIKPLPMRGVKRMRKRRRNPPRWYARDHVFEVLGVVPSGRADD